MAGYPGLGRITDPATAAVCKRLFDDVDSLLRRVTTLEAIVARLETQLAGGATGTIETTADLHLEVESGLITRIT